MSGCSTSSLAFGRLFGRELSEQYASCVDQHESCKTWAKEGECDHNKPFMLTGCRAACLVCQSEHCHDNKDECNQWAANGECAANTDFMVEECPFSCKTCNINSKPACKRAHGMWPAAVPGTINETFDLILRNYSRYGPSIISRDPWILRFDHFLNASEADYLVKKGGHGFERSLAGDGVTPVRTSSTSWCNVPSCLNDPLVQEIRRRISAITRVPWEYAEHLQVLKYEPGQFYREHHDQNSPRYSAWGPRLYTFFMYLSDVEEGGHTRFTHLNISVPPVKGSAILWPSVHSADPFKTDERTYHEAMTVIRGLKYSANFWIHMYEFQQALLRGCDNSDYFQDDLLAEIGLAGSSLAQAR
uniref:Fe2OG dioxygenase domain-containing protein n=1 Tax=Coccolithus braarudii TaxID=221442 RepID=A0A7S0LH06_9EUKA